MEQDGQKAVISLEMPPELKDWLLRKSAERLAAGLPVAERSMGAVIRDLISAAMDQEQAA